MIRDKPKAFCAYFTMGVAFADAGIYREAIRMWKKVVEIAPDSPEAASARESIDVLRSSWGSRIVREATGPHRDGSAFR